MLARIDYLARRLYSLVSSTLHRMYITIASLVRGRHIVRGNFYIGQRRTNVLEQTIFDLNSLSLSTPGTKVELTSFPFGNPTNTEPGIASIVLQRGRGYHCSNYFTTDMSLALKEQATKPLLVVSAPVFLIPYMTNHFGHFTGECLGSIIELSHRIPAGERKLHVLFPTVLEDSIKNHSRFDNLISLDANTLDKNNLLFTDAVILPRLSPWQNLCLAQQIYRKLHTPTSVKHEKVFLTSQRPDRISNVSEVVAHLRSKGFFILNPTAHSFEETLSIIRQCDCLITENGSITHNVLIARTAPYLVLTSAKGLTLNASEFAGGGIFNAFNSYHAQHLICQPNTDKQSHHAYSTQIYVDIADLDQAISKLNKLAFN